MGCVWGLVLKQKTVSPPAQPRYSRIPYHRSPEGEHPRMFCVEFRERALVSTGTRTTGVVKRTEAKGMVKRKGPCFAFQLYTNRFPWRSSSLCHHLVSIMSTLTGTDLLETELASV